MRFLITTVKSVKKPLLLGCGIFIMCGVLLAGYAVKHNVFKHMEKDKKGISISWEKEPFLCYISGMEGRKVLVEKKRRYSDVNLLAAVNPFSHKILLINTPRDTLLTVPKVGDTEAVGQAEKLDAMPLYGRQASKRALEELYGVRVNCTVRVDYMAFKEAVDALGGVSVYSEMSFESDWGPAFQEGDNAVNGREALAFVRERHHLPEGDIQRGRNQQYMIAAIMEKFWQTRNLSVFRKLLSIARERIDTNLSMHSLRELLQWQMKDSTQWKVENYTIEGEQSGAVTYSSNGQEIYVFLPNRDSVQTAAEKIKKHLSYTSGD